MKYLIIILLLISGAAYGQTTYYIRADSTRMQKVGGSNELILENATRATTGVLVNYGNGRTKFSKPRINGDTLFIGVDTILGVNAASYTFPRSVVAPGSAIQLENDTSAFANGVYTFNSAGRRTWQPISAIRPTWQQVLNVGRSGDSAIIDNGATGESFIIRNRNASLGFPVAAISPVTDNKNIAFDIVPRGSPGDYSNNGIAWMDICDVNVLPGTGNVGAARVGITSTEVQFGSRAFGVSAKPVSLIVDTDKRITLNTNNTADFNIGKITQSQSLSGDYVGYSIFNTNTSVAESNAIFFVGSGFGSLTHGYIRYNNAATSSGWRQPDQFEIAANSHANSGLVAASLSNRGKIDLVTSADGTNAFVRARIDSAGNFGINTTTPTTKLHVNGTNGFRYVDGSQSAGYILTSDATGVASWQANSGGGNYVLRSDIYPIATFGGGGGNAGDTTSFTTSTIYGSFYTGNGLDTLSITGMNIGLQGSSPNVTVTVYWNDSLNVTAGATKLVNAGSAATNIYTGTSVTTFDNWKIPPGVWVWVKTTTVATKPTFLTITLQGFREGRIAP